MLIDPNATPPRSIKSCRQITSNQIYRVAMHMDGNHLGCKMQVEKQGWNYLSRFQISIMAWVLWLGKFMHIIILQC